jgi:PAP2 superfamily protein
MNERALPISNAAETDWVATDLDQTVSQELHGRTEQALSLRVLLWRLLAVGLNIGLFMILFQLYKLVRKTAITRGETVGFQHAVDLINLEKRLHLFFEPDLQRWILDRPEWVIRGLNYYYAGFMPLFYACCAIGLIFGPVRFRFWRRVFFCSMLLALPWYLLYPLAPPRFMNTDFGYAYDFIDTLKIWGPNYFSNSGLVSANQFAAMPSMHIGWSTIGALAVATCLPRIKGFPIGWVIGGFHITMMTLTVMATGNHYFLDEVGGWLVVCGSLVLAWFLTDRFPVRLPKWFSPT